MSKRQAIAEKVADKIVALLKRNRLQIRPYEGEISCCVIEEPYTANEHEEYCYIMCPSRHSDDYPGMEVLLR